MKPIILAFTAVAILSAPVAAAPVIGQPAPNFKVADTDGKPHFMHGMQKEIIVQ